LRIVSRYGATPSGLLEVELLLIEKSLMTDKVIDPDRFYSLSEIVKLGLIPSIDNVVKASRLVQSDKMINKILNATAVKRGEKGIQYKVKGANIINYLAQKEI